jgi:hypothetical protein
MVERFLPELLPNVVVLPLRELTCPRLRSKIDAAPFFPSVVLNPPLGEVSVKVLLVVPLNLFIGSTVVTVWVLGLIK